MINSSSTLLLPSEIWGSGASQKLHVEMGEVEVGDAPEIRVCPRCQFVDNLLQGSAGPFHGEMNVLQEHPAAVFVCLLQFPHGNRLLPLPQAH